MYVYRFSPSDNHCICLRTTQPFPSSFPPLPCLYWDKFFPLFPFLKDWNLIIDLVIFPLEMLPQMLHFEQVSNIWNLCRKWSSGFVPLLCMSFSSGSDLNVYWYFRNCLIMLEKEGIHRLFLLAHRSLCHCTKGCRDVRTGSLRLLSPMCSTQLYFVIPFRNFSNCIWKAVWLLSPSFLFLLEACFGTYIFHWWEE